MHQSGKVGSRTLGHKAFSIALGVTICCGLIATATSDSVGKVRIELRSVQLPDVQGERQLLYPAIARSSSLRDGKGRTSVERDRAAPQENFAVRTLQKTKKQRYLNDVDRNRARAVPGPKNHDATNVTVPAIARIITIPMSPVPPRAQIPGSSQGMPTRVRIVEIDKRRGNLWHRIFRRGIRSTAPILFKSRQLPDDSNLNGDFSGAFNKQVYSVDLQGGIVGVGEYYSIIELGGKSIRVQVDTGSSTLAVPMIGCTSCIKKTNRYAIREYTNARAIKCFDDECTPDRCGTNCPICSSKGSCCASEHPSQCGFSLRYADGSSASGSLVSDEVRWGELRSNLTFGGILSNSPNFERPEVDGILGMAYKSLACNPSCIDPPFDVFVQNKLIDDIFSICMSPTGGKLMLGGYKPSVAKSPVQYVPLSLSKPARYYRIKLSGSLQIGNNTVSVPNFRTAIVDTGTTLIVTSTPTFAAIKQYFQSKYCDVPELCEEDSWFQSGMCVSLSRTDLERLPPLTITLTNGVGLTLAPTDYMLEYRRGSKIYRCIGIMGMDGIGGMVVLGNTLMQKYVTVYDRANQQLGFAEAAPNCGG
jgi:hypothetical protein